MSQAEPQNHRWPNEVTSEGNVGQRCLADLIARRGTEDQGFYGKPPRHQGELREADQGRHVISLRLDRCHSCSSYFLFTWLTRMRSPPSCRACESSLNATSSDSRMPSAISKTPPPLNVPPAV